jgi:hypothetical protein
MQSCIRTLRCCAQTGLFRVPVRLASSGPSRTHFAGRQPRSRARIAEQDVVYGSLKANLGIQRTPGFARGEVAQEEGEEGNEVLYEHLERYFEEHGGTELEPGQWLELREDLEGFPVSGRGFQAAGRSVTRTSVDSCLLQYLRHSGQTSLAISLAAFLRGLGPLQPAHLEHLLKIHLMASDLASDAEAVSLCGPLLAGGPANVPENIYWLAVQLAARCLQSYALCTMHYVGPPRGAWPWRRQRSR